MHGIMPQSNKPFNFKQFEVQQSRSAMKVGTDAVLLAAWTNLNKVRYMLDAGTGTGVIALICAQRNQAATIEAIEIDDESAEDARYNFEHSPWSERLKMHEGDFLKIVSVEKFDLIISNPPYFTSSLRAANPSRSAARHDDSLPADGFLIQCKKLLAPQGRVALIIPTLEFARWMDAANASLFQALRICHVFTMADKDTSTRVMLELGIQPTGEPAMESLLIRKGPEEYSGAYKQLTKDFYLKW
ncbi:MAG: tRNA1(Val) (adenine(37)-N6)-methyltransferase [Flavobacteriales bacterium]